MDMRVPPLRIKIMFESNPLESTTLVRRLGVCFAGQARSQGCGGEDPFLHLLAAGGTTCNLVAASRNAPSCPGTIAGREGAASTGIR